MFAVYFAAVTTLTEEQCRTHLGGDQRSVADRYRFGAEQALARAGFLTTQKFAVLQALVIFLVSFIYSPGDYDYDSS